MKNMQIVNGFVSLKVVNHCGYTKEEAEEQGLIIKDR